MKKKGMSAIITTVILVALSMVAILIVWGVISNILASGEKDTQASYNFLKLRMDVVSVENNSGNLIVNVERGVGAGMFNELSFIVTYLNGETEIVKKPAVISEPGVGKFVLDLSRGFENVSSVAIVPIYTASDGETSMGNVLDEFEIREIIIVDYSEDDTTDDSEQCLPNCFEKTCGNDSCGGSCGDCFSPEICGTDGVCTCAPSCVSPGVCGASDGCGGTCPGVCEVGVCADGECVAILMPEVSTTYYGTMWGMDFESDDCSNIQYDPMVMCSGFSSESQLTTFQECSGWSEPEWDMKESYGSKLVCGPYNSKSDCLENCNVQGYKYKVVGGKHFINCEDPDKTGYSWESCMMERSEYEWSVENPQCQIVHGMDWYGYRWEYLGRCDLEVYDW